MMCFTSDNNLNEHKQINNLDI